MAEPPFPNSPPRKPTRAPIGGDEHDSTTSIVRSIPVDKSKT